MRYAAHDDASIYAVAQTPEAAVAKARSEANDLRASFSVARIGNALADRIEAEGWDGRHRSFDVVDGEIRDTTGDAR